MSSLIYYFLPVIFRQLSIKGGDLSKTSRERHVISKLYSFFVFNNLIMFSFFGAVVKIIAATAEISQNSGLHWTDVIREVHPLVNIMVALCQISSFWITWLIQRNLSAAMDLSQAVNLGWGSFSRFFLDRTPREVITRTAPAPFDYATYYSYFLFSSTVSLCFGPLQPLVFLVTAFYFTIDGFMKKYLLL